MTDNDPPWLRVMSFNLHVDWPASPRPWRERRDVVAHLLRMERPHLIGTQEGLHGPLRDLEADLGPEHYGWIGQGREGGSRGEFMAIGYDRTRLRPLEYDHFWPSGTPQEPGSNTWGGGWTRMVTWVRFHDLSGGPPSSSPSGSTRSRPTFRASSPVTSTPPRATAPSTRRS